MALYTKDSIERVKESVDMVQLVGVRSDLRRVGTRWVGLCPFHDERTPSFSVNAEHKLFHCFGCGESGDAIGFVQATEALDFPGAVELLADRYGVELKREDEDPKAEARRQRRERLLRIVERTARYYERMLWESGEASRAREYLAARGLGEQVLKDFRIGYAPSAWDRVTVGAQRDGFTQEELAGAGLAQRGRQGGLYDRFRGRIMFPLADSRGRVLGFGARSLTDEQRPKYLNTSENELYHKGRQLFGIDRARQAAAKKGRIVAVEGYTDVLALHQGGITETVAIMGTALTQEQLAELSRAVGAAGTLYLALDADRAGQDAMLRAGRGARERGVELRAIGMPEGTDPAELVERDGVERFEQLLSRAVTVPEFEVRRALADADLDDPAAKDRALASVVPIVRSVAANSVLRDHLMRLVADKLEVPFENLHVLVESSAPVPEAPPRANGDRPAGRDGRSGEAPAVEAVAAMEREFLMMCVADRTNGREYLERVEEDHFTTGTLRRVRDHLLGHFDDPLAELPQDDPSLSAVVTDLAMRGEVEHRSPDVLRLTFLQLEFQRIKRQLWHAERDRDLQRQRDLWPVRESIKLQIDELMGQDL